MALNDCKQQVLGLTKEVRDAWKFYGDVTQITKDLEYTTMRTTTNTRIWFQTTNQRIKIAGGAQRQRGTMMASVLYGKCLYGSAATISRRD